MKTRGLHQYISYRRRFWERLDAVQEQLDELLARIGDGDMSLQDLAILEGLHGEKRRLFTEFLEIEDALINGVLASRASHAIESDIGDGERLPD